MIKYSKIKEVEQDADKGKTREHLINEQAELRQRIAELEKSEKGRRQAEEALQFSETRYRGPLYAADCGREGRNENRKISM